jgi:hypothetical protein
VGDHVVEVPGDPQPLFDDPAAGLLLPGLLQVPGPLLEAGQVGPAAADGLAQEHGDRRPAREQEVHRTQLRAGPAQPAGHEDRHRGRDGERHRAAALAGGRHRVDRDPGGHEHGPSRVVAHAVDDERQGDRRDDRHRPSPPPGQRAPGDHDGRVPEHVETPTVVLVGRDLRRDSEDPTREGQRHQGVERVRPARGGEHVHAANGTTSGPC